MQVIKLIDALRLMESVGPDGKRLPFDLTGTKYNRKTKEGGTRYHYPNCELPYGVEKPVHSASTNKADDQAKHKKSPNHYKNATRNLKIPGQRHPVKVNIFLIERFGFQGVTYEVIL